MGGEPDSPREGHAIGMSRYIQGLASAWDLYSWALLRGGSVI